MTTARRRFKQNYKNGDKTTGNGKIGGFKGPVCIQLDLIFTGKGGRHCNLNISMSPFLPQPLQILHTEAPDTEINQEVAP